MASVLKKRTTLCVTSISSSSSAASKHLLSIFYFTGISLMMPCVGKWSWCNGDVPLPEHCPVMPIYSDSRQSNILCGTCADLTREGGGELLLSSVGPRCACIEVCRQSIVTHRTIWMTECIRKAGRPASQLSVRHCRTDGEWLDENQTGRKEREKIHELYYHYYY
jgi:hypothetical protein